MMRLKGDTLIYEITPSYFIFLACDLFISPYHENNIIKINNTNKILLWL